MSVVYIVVAEQEKITKASNDINSTMSRLNNCLGRLSPPANQVSSPSVKKYLGWNAERIWRSIRYLRGLSLKPCV